MSEHNNSEMAFQTTPLPYDSNSLDQKLVEAVQENSLKLVQDLLNQGANPNVLGMIAPHDENLVRKIPTGKKGSFIIEDDNIRTTPSRVQGRTPLYVAVAEGYYDIAKALLDGGAHPDMPIEGGLCPLTIAVESRHDRNAFTNLLLDYGANPNVKSPYGGGTALSHAISCGTEFNTVARMLNEGNADPRIKDNYGKDTLEKAAERNWGLSGYLKSFQENPGFMLMIMAQMIAQPSSFVESYKIARNDRRVKRAIKQKIKALNKG